jgi:hypothetical protein
VALCGSGAPYHGIVDSGLNKDGINNYECGVQIKNRTTSLAGALALRCSIDVFQDVFVNSCVFSSGAENYANKHDGDKIQNDEHI